MSCNYKPAYLECLNAFKENIACFIPRLPGIETSTDRHTCIAALTPKHEEIMREVGIDPRHLRRAQQVHGNKVAMVGDIGCSYPIDGVDGLICSHNADCSLGIYVADCAAVWIYDQKIGTRALIHSGKAGTEQNIAQTTLKAMYRFEGTKAEDCIAVISPCIRPAHYECDIASLIVQQLKEAGLSAENIIDCGIDTAADTESYYSYRMEKGDTGRMLALFGRIPHELSH